MKEEKMMKDCIARRSGHVIKEDNGTAIHGSSAKVLETALSMKAGGIARNFEASIAERCTVLCEINDEDVDLDTKSNLLVEN